VRIFAWRRFVLAAMAATLLPALGVTARAQGLPSEPVVLAGGRVTIGGGVSASFSCGSAEDAGPCESDPGFFNYSDYEHSTLRMLRLDVSAAVHANRHLSLLAEVRSENGEAPRPYALYLRYRPWEQLPIDIQAGRVPPTFGAFSRRNYPSDNVLIGYPLAYQYLTSLRPDAIPAGADELFEMRARGWRSSFSIGDPEPDRGLPLATAFHWDTGVQVHVEKPWADGTIAVTTGSLANPRVRDDNNGRQIAGRVAVRPLAGLQIGVSGSRAAFLTRDAAMAAGVSSRDFPQTATGLDLEYSRDYYLVRVEAILNTWRLPTIAEPLRANGISIEGRYRFRPGWHAAVRVDHLGFNRIEGDAGASAWDAPVTRVEIGGGYLIRRNVQLKLSMQHNARDGGRVHSLNLVSAQAVVWF
jgi:hypothetical protein